MQLVRLFTNIFILLDNYIVMIYESFLFIYAKMELVNFIKLVCYQTFAGNGTARREEEEELQLFRFLEKMEKWEDLNVHLLCFS